MKNKYPLAAARDVAERLLSALSPFCERIIIAGSIRREKSECSDVELLFVPKIVEVPDGLFDTKKSDMAANFIEDLLKCNALAKRPNIKGAFTWGEKIKLAIDTASGIPVDLFATTKENWAMSLVVRTGSADLNKRLAETAIKNGKALHAFGCGFTDNKTGKVIPCHTEEDVFRIAGCSYLEPKARIA